MFLRHSCICSNQPLCIFHWNSLFCSSLRHVFLSSLSAENNLLMPRQIVLWRTSCTPADCYKDRLSKSESFPNLQTSQKLVRSSHLWMDGIDVVYHLQKP